MSDVTQVLTEMGSAETASTDRLLPLVYGNLRRLATMWVAREAPGQTLQVTALVHEAYLRLVSSKDEPRWDSSEHFFAAAAETMRRILVENARRKACIKRGGGWRRVDAESAAPEPEANAVDLLSLDQALAKLAIAHPRKARLIELRFFGGLTMEQAAAAMDLSAATAYRDWTYAKAWLHREMFDQHS